MTPHCNPTIGFPSASKDNQGPALCVLSFGIGQDSWALLLMLAFDREFRQKYAPGRLLILSAETGDEHPETYQHLEYTRKFCKEHGLEYVHITPDMGHHPATWPGLREQYRRSNTVGSKTFRKSCTDNLKLVPIYGYLDSWLGQNYNLPSGRKEAIKLFAQKHGKISVLVGLAAKEEKRCATPGSDPAKWRRCSVQISYPLIDLGMDRADCQQYARSHGQPVPLPSNCMLCPYMNDPELVYLARFHRTDYEQWVEIEHNKIKACAHQGDLTKTLNKKGQIVDNSGVWGKKLLPEALKDALAKYGHWSDGQLREYKFSHGHSVASKY
ncbi:hypothetical protein [Geoalkalibacter halelectricus]|uniref:hypothetical protein n=1 Tax=Geoalkalibacter halelectricus TaxID=2847045 RepID=UPI00266EF39E|nr:hypothetical protein [Geoalkalibacter halelectricus]MDO3380395.1 hypothetical protein [Geoalkalibacter halelectricus]